MPSTSAEAPLGAEIAPSEAEANAPANRRPRPWDRVSLLWRVFAANVLVLVVAVVLLAWTPVTVHRVARPGELAALAGGLVLMLLFDLVLLRRAFGPLRRLAAVMSEVEPSHPGRRAEAPEGAGSEVVALTRALNAMLDRLEGERRESGRRALAAQEGERTRVARELHDEVGQTLTAIALQAEHAADEPTGRREALTEIADSLRHSLEDVHRIGRELRPEALDDLGLVNALIALCSRVDREGGMRVRRDLDWHLPTLSAEEELVIYRVGQEALTNALRHAQATEVRVSLKRTDGHVVLTVEDNGRGLPDRVRESGLAGMRERALLIDAELKVRSDVGRGTAVVLTVPGAAT
jgi:two-component system sensor histidine kinase UhpB